MSCKTSHWILLVVGKTTKGDSCINGCAGISGSQISPEYWPAVTNTPGNLDHLIELKVQRDVISFWTLTLKSSV